MRNDKLRRFGLFIALGSIAVRRPLSQNEGETGCLRCHSGLLDFFLQPELASFEFLDSRRVGRGSVHFFAKLGFDTGMFRL